MHKFEAFLKLINFYYSSNTTYKLKRHMEQMHTKKLLYECGACKYSTYRKDGLRAHIRLVHEKYRPHQCDFCDAAFYYRRDKAKHLMKNHNVAKRDLKHYNAVSDFSRIN